MRSEQEEIAASGVVGSNRSKWEGTYTYITGVTEVIRKKNHVI